MSQAGSNVAGGGGGGTGVTTLTGNSGGAVPPTLGNINILGSGGITVSGNAGTSTLTISDTVNYSITPYIVGPTGNTSAQFTGDTAIAQALAQIVIDNPTDANIYIEPGTYNNGAVAITIPAGPNIILYGLGLPSTGTSPAVVSTVIIGSPIIGTGGVFARDVQITGAMTLGGANNSFNGCNLDSSTITNSASINCYFTNCSLTSTITTSATNPLMGIFNNCNVGGTITAASNGGDFFAFKNCLLPASTAFLNTATITSPTLIIADCIAPAGTFLDDTLATIPWSVSIDGLALIGGTTGFILNPAVTWPSLNNISTPLGLTTFLIDTAGTGGSSITLTNSSVMATNLLTLADNDIIIVRESTFQGAIVAGLTDTIILDNCITVGNAVPSLGAGSVVRYVGTTSSGEGTIINSTALATNATDGFLYVDSCAGVPTGVPVAYGASIPLVVDSSSDTPYIYSSGAWNAIGGGGGGASLSPYIVGTTGTSDFSTIQAAINQAVTDGASSTNILNIYVKPGTYTENINIKDGINIVGFSPTFFSQASLIFGVLSPPNASAVLDGTITIGDTGTSYISGMMLKRASAGDGIIASNAGILNLKDFSISLSNGTVFIFTAASTIIADSCSFINNLGATSILYSADGAILPRMFFNQVSLDHFYLSSTITNAAQVLMFCNNCYLDTTQSIDNTATKFFFHARYSRLPGNSTFLTIPTGASSGSTLDCQYCDTANMLTDIDGNKCFTSFAFSAIDNVLGTNESLNTNICLDNVTGSGIITTAQSSAASTLVLGTPYQNTLGYDVMLIVYIDVTASVAGSILSGVGSSSTPTQQTVYSSSSVGVVPVTVYLPNNYYASISISGTITAAIMGQQTTPV